MEPISNLISLKQERAAAIAEMQRIQAEAAGESRGLTAEQRQEFDRLDEAVRDMTKLVEHAEAERNLGPGGVTRGHDLDGSELAGSTAVASDEYRDAFGAYLRHGMGELSPEQRSALRAGYREQRDMTVAGAGAFVVPQDFYATVIAAKVPAVAMRRTRALHIETANGRDLPIPVQTAFGAANYLTEGSALSNVDDTGSKVTAKAYTVARMTKVSFQLLEDAAVDVTSLLASSFAKAFAVFEDPEFLKGTGAGSSHITGVTSGTTVKQAAVGSTTTFTYTDLLAQYFGIQPQYRVNGEWVIADTALATLAGLKDSSNRPIWTASAIPGEPDSLMGKPLYSSPNFATEAANSLYGVFGDFANGYAIRDDGGLQVRRTDERFIDSLEAGFIGWERVDGVILDQTAFAVLKHSAT